MTPKQYVQTIKEKELLHKKILELSADAPETYKMIFEKISRDLDGLALSSDPIEIARVWFSGIAFAFQPNSDFYLEDIEQLINDTPDEASLISDLPQLGAMIDELHKTIHTLKDALSKYLVLHLEKIKLQKECEDRYKQYRIRKEWEKDVSGVYKELETREYKQEYACTQPELLETVLTLCSEYIEKPPSDVMVDNDKEYFYLGKPLPLYYAFDLGQNQLGDNVLRIEKLYTFDSDNLLFDASTYETIPELADGASCYEEIGHITIGQTPNGNSSTILTKTDNADLLSFFKMIMGKINIPQEQKINKAGRTGLALKRTTGKKTLIFVSHISEEKEIALALKQLAISAFQDNIDVFVSADPASIPLGKKWLDQITDALRNCDVLIVMCSPTSVLRPWINFEAGAGWVRKIPVIPLCHSGMTPATLPIPLKLLQAGNAVEEKIILEIMEIAANKAKLPVPSVNLTTYIEQVKAFESTYKIDDLSLQKMPSVLDAITSQPEDGYYHFRIQRLITLNDSPDEPIYVTNQRKRALISIAKKLSQGHSIQIGGTSIDPSDIYFGSVSLVVLRSKSPVVKSLFSVGGSKSTDKFWAALRDLDDTDDITAELDIHNPYDKE